MANKTKKSDSTIKTSRTPVLSTRSYTLVFDSAEGIRVPFDRKAAKEIAQKIAGDSRLTALG